MSNQQEWNSAAMEHYKPPQEPTQQWRVGRKVPINVYDGDRPVCQCQTAEDARFIVAAVNAAIADEKMFKRAEIEELTELPATPAPSQPAAREWKRQESCPECDGDGCAACLADVDEWFRVNRPKLHDAVKYAAGEKGKAFDIIVFEACDAYARQQTAAKDTEAEIFRCQLRDALKLHPNVTWFGAGLLAAASVVVAERDSLREANERLAADLDAALKAEKDGQQ